jgi:hypothetical protein
VFDFLTKLHDMALNLISEIKFEKRDEISRTIASLYASLIEQTGSLLALINTKKRAGTDAIFRSFVEAFVDIINLINDPEYINFMRSKYHAEWLKVMKESAKGTNPYLAGMATIPDFDKVIDEHENNLNELKKNGFSQLTIADAFKRAGMEDVYRSVYNFLCSESHNNIRSLIARHIDFSGEDFGIVMYKEAGERDFEATLDTVAGMLMSASLGVHKHFGSTATAINGLHEMDGRLAQLRIDRETDIESSSG